MSRAASLRSVSNDADGDEHDQFVNDNDNDNDCDRLILLPDDQHNLYYWKARPGSAVRKGETVALATKNDSSCGAVTEEDDNSKNASSPYKKQNDNNSNSCVGDSSNNSAAKMSTDAHHKRPTRRRLRHEPSSTPIQSDGTKHTEASQSQVHNMIKRSMPLKDASTLLSSSSSRSKRDLIPIIAQRNGILRIGLPTCLKSFKYSNNIVKGYIERCTHPTVVDGLCAVCGAAVNVNSRSRSAASSGIVYPRPGPYISTSNPCSEEENKTGTSASSSSSTSPLNEMYRMTVSGGVTVSVSNEEGKLIADFDSVRLRKIRKLSLVLDLDHTLVHATGDVQAQPYVHNHPDVRSLMLPIPIFCNSSSSSSRTETSGSWKIIRVQHFVKLRPFVKEFLTQCSACYELGVYTAGTREYAEQVTLILARHMVNATRDQIDLEQLRQIIASAEAEIGRRQTQRASQVESVELSNQGDSSVDNANHIETDCRLAPDALRKRKRRVMFQEPSLDINTDIVSEEQLQLLKQELADAERLEEQAIEMRQKLFGSRVVTRTDVGDLGRDVKSLKRIFPCGGTMAAVVDDREDVWANAKDQALTASRRLGEPPDNLLLVRPYHWSTFLGFSDINNSSGADLSIGLEEKESSRFSSNHFLKRDNYNNEQDEQLLWTTDILLRLHGRYYEYQGKDRSRPTVPELLSTMRREVLAGCNIVLSGLIPLSNQQEPPSRPDGLEDPRHSIIRYVENWGGRIQSGVTSEVTHVIAAKDGTDKINAARKTRGCIVVKMSWLMECVWSLTRRDENPHILEASSRPSPPPPAVPLLTMVPTPLTDSRKESSVTASIAEDADDDDDDDYDDMAAELENEFLCE